MPKKIRVYELARELGVENADILTLSEELKIGVKSHSSSIEEAQADRVRRLAREKGIAKSVEELEEERKAEEARKRAEEIAKGERKVIRAGGAPSKAAGPATTTEGTSPIVDEPSALAPEPEPTHRVIRSTVQTEAEVPERADAPSPAPVRAPAPTAPTPVAPASPGRANPPARPSVDRPAVERPAASAAPPAAPEAPTDADAVDGESARTPLSSTGRPIPPPPGLGGRKIPPPPPRGGPRTSGGPGGPRTSGGPGGGPRPSGGGGPGGGAGGGYRPSGPPGTGQRPGGGPPPPGGGRGRPGGPPGRKRKKRRRRREEELEPQQATTFTPEDAPVPEGEIVIERGITPQEYAPKLNRTSADIVRLLMQAGEMVTATQSLSDEMIELIADELGAEILLVNAGQEEEVELQALLSVDDDDDEDDALLEWRPPVVTVMGHVDHGKTLLLDKIRSANVVAQEAGGITQHIGAYQVERDGKKMTFIDTPGHEAFTAMRARGAEATDIAVLVVAGDDGVMPQTVEALNHAKAADVPIIVAINKVDREDADPQRVRQQLSEHGLIPEEWGGETVMNEVSAMTGAGIDELLESILLVAEVEELVANPKVPARAVVLEANLDPGRGPLATVIVERGTLRVGDPVVAGAAWGRVRALVDDRGGRIDDAGPSTPVEVMGFEEVPTAGDELRVAPDEKTARTVAEARGRRRRHAQLVGTISVTGGGARLEDIFSQIQAGEVASLNLILKADVQGSLEAITEALRRLERDEVKLNFVHRGVGGITESDVTLAAASSATIIGFNVRPDRIARELAEQDDVEIRLYEVIYKAIEEVEAAMLGMLEPEFEEVVTGEAEVREIFGIPRVGKVAGCYVTNGVIKRGDKVRFLRDGVVIWNGEISSLKRFKEDAREVASGYECGIGLSDFQDLKAGDVIETYENREIART
ncbi:MAG TPA: translation initiation factor IF-2 [Acidimicrobiia bacterium]|nr:translation initiation factor IF-2 [Acidimicrobiia bacterium]